MTFYPSGGTSSAPSGPAGGVLTGTYPNPGFATAPAFTGNLSVTGGTITATGNISGAQLIGSAGVQVAGGFVDVVTVNRGLAVAEGSNAKQGIATLVAGTVTVANTSVTANSKIFVTCQILGTVTVASAFDTPRTAGTSFTIHASQATDTSTVAWEIFEPG